MTPTPDFLAAVEQHQHLAKPLGLEHPATSRAMLRVMALAPDELMDEFGRMARELDLLPAPVGYDEDGQPMYRTTDLANNLGLTAEEVEAGMQEMLDTRSSLGLEDDGPTMDVPPRIHRVQ